MRIEPKSIVLLLAMATASLSTSCLSDRGPPSSLSDDMPGFEMNRIVGNGVHPNGVHPNGSGTASTGVTFSSIVLANSVVGSAFHIEGEKLVATINGNPSNVSDFIGAEMTEYLPNGTSWTLRIDDVTTAPSTLDPQVQNVVYTLSYWDTYYEDWLPRCGMWPETETEPERPREAYALKDRWDLSKGLSTSGSKVPDSTMFTMACRGYAIGKCVDFGYEPWSSKEEWNGEEHESRSLETWHQTCTRMTRADYCGDGYSFTEDGTEINIWDVLNIQEKALGTGMDFEAEWTPAGASCVNHPRFTETGGSTLQAEAEDHMDLHCPGVYVGLMGDCPSSTSTFETTDGFSTSLSERVQLHNESLAAAP